eukprot:Pgem_evm1s10282
MKEVKGNTDSPFVKEQKGVKRKNKVAVCVLSSNEAAHKALVNNWKDNFVKDDYDFFYSSTNSMIDTTALPWTVGGFKSIPLSPDFNHDYNECLEVVDKFGETNKLPFGKKFPVCSMMILQHQKKNPGIHYTHAVQVKDDMVFGQKMDHVEDLFAKNGALKTDVLHFDDQFAVIKGPKMHNFFIAIEMAYSDCYDANEWQDACPEVSDQEVTKMIKNNKLPCSLFRMAGSLGDFKLQSCRFRSSHASIDCNLSPSVLNSDFKGGDKKMELNYVENAINQEDICNLNGVEDDGEKDSMEKRKAYVMTLPYKGQGRYEMFRKTWANVYPALELHPIYGSLTQTRGMGLVFSFIKAVDQAIEDDVDVAIFFEDDAIPFAGEEANFVRNFEIILQRWANIPEAVMLYLGGHGFIAPGPADYVMGLTRVIHVFGTYGFAVRKRHLKCYAKLLRKYVEEERNIYNVDIMMFCTKGTLFRQSSKYTALATTPLLIDHKTGISHTWKTKVSRPFEGNKEWEQFDDSVTNYDRNDPNHLKLARCEVEEYKNSDGNFKGSSMTFDENSRILIGVQSSVKTIEARVAAARKTWLLNNDDPLYDVHFFVGKSEKPVDMDQLVKKLNLRRNQIHVLPSPDSEYPPVAKANLSNSNHKWILRIDDDTFLDTQNLYTFVSKLNKPGFYGRVGFGRPSDKQGLLSLGLDKFCMGGPGYVMSFDVLSKLAEHSEDCLAEMRSFNYEKKKQIWHADLFISFCVKKYTGHDCSK